MRITELDIIRFTEGDCHILARAIHLLTGWPMFSFDDGHGDPDLHAFVIAPSGKALDIEGLHSLRDLRRDWGSSPLVETSYEAIVSIWGHETSFGRYSFARARKLAPMLVEAVR